jgi:hypothetical protein
MSSEVPSKTKSATKRKSGPANSPAGEGSGTSSSMPPDGSPANPITPADGDGGGKKDGDDKAPSAYTSAEDVEKERVAKKLKLDEAKKKNAEAQKRIDAARLERTRVATAKAAIEALDGEIEAAEVESRSLAEEEKKGSDSTNARPSGGAGNNNPIASANTPANASNNGTAASAQPSAQKISAKDRLRAEVKWADEFLPKDLSTIPGLSEKSGWYDRLHRLKTELHDRRGDIGAGKISADGTLGLLKEYVWAVNTLSVSLSYRTTLSEEVRRKASASWEADFWKNTSDLPLDELAIEGLRVASKIKKRASSESPRGGFRGRGSSSFRGRGASRGRGRPPYQQRTTYSSSNQSYSSTPRYQSRDQNKPDSDRAHSRERERERDRSPFRSSSQSSSHSGHQSSSNKGSHRRPW